MLLEKVTSVLTCKICEPFRQQSLLYVPHVLTCVVAAQCYRVFCAVLVIKGHYVPEQY